MNGDASKRRSERSGVAKVSAQENGCGAVLLGKKRKQIRRDEFRCDDSLVDVVVAEGVERIKTDAFAECPNLRSVILPKSLRTLEWGAFQSCTRLASVQIPEGVTWIGRLVFEGCTSLEEIVLPNSLTRLDDIVFSKCSALQKVVIGAGLKRIEDKSFADCKALRSVVIPANVTRIGDRAFAGCTALESVAILGNCAIGNEAFAGCAALKEVKVQGSVTQIGISAFKGCTALCSVAFPDGLECVHEKAFEGCTALRSAAFPNGLEDVGRNAFEGCASLVSVTLPATVSIEFQCFLGCTSLPTLIVDGKLLYLAERGKTAVVPEGVVRIGRMAFAGDEELESVVLPDSLEGIGPGAFFKCPNLKSVAIPEGVKVISDSAFSNCEALSAVRLPEVLKRIGDGAFSGCRNLATVSVGGQEPVEGECIIPAGVKVCGWMAFNGCAFTKVRFSDGVEELGKWTFLDCNNLTEVVLPKSVQSLSCWVFKDCKNLKRVVISYGALRSIEADDPAVVPKDASGAFICADICAGCALQEVVVPDYLEVHLRRIFRDALPHDVKVVVADGTVRPWQRETPKALAFFKKHGIHAYEVKYSGEPAHDYYFAGCRMQSPAKETRSVVVPAKYKDGDARELVAEIYARGASKTYSISVGEEELESYSLQRDAKKSKFWPVFAALAAYKPLRWN